MAEEFHFATTVKQIVRAEAQRHRCQNPEARAIEAQARRHCQEKVCVWKIKSCLTESTQRAALQLRIR